LLGGFVEALFGAEQLGHARRDLIETLVERHGQWQTATFLSLRSKK
jgi:hypothetical protein